MSVSPEVLNYVQFALLALTFMVVVAGLVLWVLTYQDVKDPQVVVHVPDALASDAGRGQVQNLVAVGESSLHDLALRAGTPVADRGFSLHFYPQHVRHLRYRRDVQFLHLGAGDHGALRMWVDYLSESAMLHVLDSRLPVLEEAKFHLDLPHVVWHHVDLAQETHVERFTGEQQFGSFHVIVDALTQTMRDQQIALVRLLPLLAQGGVYLIQDLDSSAAPQGPQFGVRDREHRDSTLSIVTHVLGGQPNEASRFEHLSEHEYNYLKEHVAGGELYARGSHRTVALHVK